MDLPLHLLCYRSYSSALLRSVRRFTARRGNPLMMVSDNGKTFKSAKREMTRVLNDPGVQQCFAKTRRKWSFSLERLVRSVKRCLKKTIGSTTLTYEELLTWRNIKGFSVSSFVIVNRLALSERLTQVCRGQALDAPKCHYSVSVVKMLIYW